MSNYDITNISKIINGLYLSGTYPLENNSRLISMYNIKYIVCCVDRKYVEKIHDKLVMENPDLTILYLAYNDILYENLWKINDDNIYIHKIIQSNEDIKKINNMLDTYKSKSMIEVAYNFINNNISNGNILIHCMAGISRSVSMIAYYLMKKYHMTLVDAITIIRNNRSIANPNDSFKLQLYKYQKQRETMTIKYASDIINSIRVAKTRG